MKVAGGYYQELCAWPGYQERFGSGGRAALAIADAGMDVDWHYYCPKSAQTGARFVLRNQHIHHWPAASDALITFDYYHSLSRPTYSPARIAKAAPIQVEGDVLLRYGFMEGDAIVKGGRVVYDPQQPHNPQLFTANGSSAEVLALVLNAAEIRALGESNDEATAVAAVSKMDKASIVIVKAGVEGCRLYENGAFVSEVPAYQSESVYKVGSGDIFSAAFAYHWGRLGSPAAEAADAASRCTARYCSRESTHEISVILNQDTDALDPVAKNNPDGRVYVAAPFFNLAERWLVEETVRILDEMGVGYFSPFHHVGLGGPEKVVIPDLDGLESSTAVLALTDGLDPGTIFEVGYAIKMNIPVIALAMNTESKRLTMLRGCAGCYLTNDFASAIYRAAWACWR